MCVSVMVGKMLVLLLLGLLSVKCETPENVKALLEDVLADKVYDKMIRGEPDLTRATDLNMSFSLMSIDSFDEIGAKLEVMGVVGLRWRDARLEWDPARYNNTNTLLILNGKVWTPHVVLGNPSTSVDLTSKSETIIRYTHNGDASLRYGDVFHVKCSAAVKSFPFDRQTCSLMFHVFGYSPKEVNLIGHSGDVGTKFFIDNGVWTLTNTSVRMIKYPHNRFIEFSLVMERKPKFYIITICVPSVLLGLLSIFAVLIPHESGERISYSITVLLSIAVFQNVISGYLPVNSVQIASICSFLLSQLGLSSVACICSIVSSKMYYSQSETPPRWLTQLVVVFTCRRVVKEETGTVIVGDETDTTRDLPEKDSSLKNEEEYTVTHDIKWTDVSKGFDRICLVILPVYVVFSLCMYTYQVQRGRDID